MSEMGFPRVPPEQSSGSGHSFGTPRHARVIDPILSKRVCFYKSGDPQFNGLRMVINNRTFKTFDALLDSLSKKVPLPFGVRNITTPRGVHAVHTLDELEDGKSYICSDNRKVKPINLALARKKPPPWYNARPVSSRRRTVQRARSFPGKNLNKHEQVFMRTPKKLLVFHNGDPTVKHTVVLHKRTTPSFESILDYISELVQYQVAKLHTADGIRVDGLPGLTLCSGTVVAVGREPFRHANYNEQKSPGPTMLPTKRVGPRRLRALKRKNKSLSYTSKSRNFSSSSEKYIVNRIHNSIAGSSYDLPSHSLELESSRMLESVLETPEGHESVLPSEDDIEKSFRVNQDGSMTVEMKVRLTIKEEETIHWTTTLSRSAVANQLNATCLPELDAEQEISSAKSNSQELQSTAASTDTINKDRPHDNNDDNPPSLCNGAFSESGIEEDDTKVHREMVSPRSTSTPEWKQMRKKQASLESIQLLTAEGIQEDMVGSYSYREQMENGAMTEQYCMVKQSSSRPVPKPRIISSSDGNSRNVSTFKSAGLMSEILQIESNEEEVQETVLHVYEQQTYQETSTFGSSTKALLAFLSVMTLKEGMANLDMVELNANNRSASKQLLQSWQGFQELKCKSRSETPIYSEDEHATQAGPEKDCGIDENVIDEIVDTLGIPDKLKEELDSLSIIVKRDNEEEIEVEPKDNIKAKISQFSTGDDNWEQGHKEDKSNQERDQTNEVVSDKQSFEEDSCSDEEGQNMSSAIKDLEVTVSCKQSASSSESAEQHSSEEEPEVECEEILNENLNPESHSEEEEEVKQPSPDYDVEVRGKKLFPVQISNTSPYQRKRNRRSDVKQAL
ncbi:Oxygen-regulated protein 1 [Dissostichus eleginoides]|uniref:Oxygen-regulated protein 1 n=1 Tax=Dissostichus eleginoides TaxID=100907 RepID=A0AAD9F0N2_DISEL|nr:Oxygen-regulated protein 1 [Dissostichus eleginoides]